MSNEEAELLARNTYRRMSRQNRAGIVQDVRIQMMIWLVAITVNIAIIHALYAALPHRPILKYFLIVVFTAVWVRQFVGVTDNIKTSPRNGNSRRGQR